MKTAHRATLFALIAAAVSACSDTLELDRAPRAGAIPGAVFLADDPACPPPRCFEAGIPVPADVTVTSNRVRIILPSGYEDTSRRWPVLYLLHDAPGDVTSWTVQGQVYDTLKDLPVIAVMPDGGGGNPGWYSDWEDGSFQWETYHMEVMLPYLAATAPDILCLQEVIHSPSSEKEWLTYRDGDHVLPQRSNLFRDVASALPDHVAIFCPAAQGVLWDGDVSIPSQWGLATFVHRSFPIIGQVQGFVHKDYSPLGFGDHPRSRSAHGVRVWDYDADRALSVTHMHGLRDLAGKMDTPERVEQAHRLRDLSSQLSEPDELIVICGDFNVEQSVHDYDIALWMKDMLPINAQGQGNKAHFRQTAR